MKKHFVLSSLALTALLAATGVSAQTAAAPAAAAKAPEPDFTFAYNVGVVSDYRYRGISQSRLDPALQGGIDFTHKSGIYLGTWLSSIKWIKDAGGKSNTEWDLYGGYKGKLGENDYDVGVLTYRYADNKLPVNANTTEIYGALTVGAITGKYSHSVTNLFGFAGSKNSGYLELAGSYDLGGGLSFAPHIGYQRVAGSGNDTATYTDYSLGLTKDVGNGLALSTTLLHTNAQKAVYYTPSGKATGRATLVLGAKYSF